MSLSRWLRPFPRRPTGLATLAWCLLAQAMTAGLAAAKQAQVICGLWLLLAGQLQTGDCSAQPLNAGQHFPCTPCSC